MLDLAAIDSSWTLFLDRDGVINVEKHLDYVRNYEEFQFMPEALDALKQLASVFSTIVIVTNQRGIARGLMTEEDLKDIHTKMVAAIREHGGRIDDIFYCAGGNDHPNRKPNPGMAFEAKALYPGIDFSKSIVVGNNPTDMEFGRNAGIYTVHVRTTHPDFPNPHDLVDLSCADLPEFASRVVNALKQ